MSEFLTAEDLKAVHRAKAHKPQPIKTNWGKAAFCRVLSAGDRDEWEASIVEGKKVNKKDMRAKFLVTCLCDEEGSPLFTAKDVSWLTDLLASDVEPVFDQCLKINGFGPKDLDELGNAPAA